MKKSLLLLTLFISIATFAKPNFAPWDKPLMPFKLKKSVLVEPDLISYGVEQVIISGQKKLHAYLGWNGYITTTWLWEFGHAGYWQDMGGWDTKVFHLYIYSGNHFDYYYNLLPQDNPTWGWWNDYYLAPLQP